MPLTRQNASSPATSPETEVVDARGQRCPMPLLMAKRALNALQSGHNLQVLATDETAIRDFEVFSRQSGHPLLAAERVGDEYHILLEKR
jgi:tRNA 2-thiouridine synthesizing protein A